MNVRIALLLIVLVPGVAAGQEPPPTPASQSPASQAPPDPLNPTQEIAKEAPEGRPLTLGPTEMRIGGYLGVTGIFRSTNSGGAAATKFATTPYRDTLQGNLSEARLTAETSRLSIRVDAAPSPGLSKLSGYFEMDFAGTTPGNVAVTTTGVGFRLRHAFGVAGYHDKYYFAAGQGFSLITPAKGQLSIWPSDYEMSYAVDTSYVAGLVWARTPQVRFTIRPSKTFDWAISVENPEQQIGNGLVKLPVCCIDELEAQYNTGFDNLGVPNLMPDIVTRAAFNPSAAVHLDVGGVLRVFRHTLKPYAEDFHQVGGGVNVNSRVNPSENTKLIGQGSYGAGMGRYVGALVPDVAVSSDGEIHPIRTFSWVTGIERRASEHLAMAGYYSGVLAYQNAWVDSDGAYIGYGYPGSPNSNNRKIHEVTAMFAWRAWKIEGRGSMQLNVQGSWLARSDFSESATARAFLFFAQLRYNLP